MPTTTVEAEVAARKVRSKRNVSFAGDLADAISTVAEESIRQLWPSDRYQDDPVSFARDILGIDPWEKQIEVLEAVRDCKTVAVPSGQKTGKSMTAAILALWFYCSFPDARVVFTSTTSKQVDGILWRELRKLHRRSGKCLACCQADPNDRKIPRPCPHSTRIDGEMHDLARSGLKANDFREVVGFTASAAEAIAGTSGVNLLYIADEATGIKDPIFEAINGNCAGGGRVVMFSNPTRPTGYFADVCLNKAHIHRVIWINSEDNPNARTGRRIYPGLAERSYIEAKREEYGGDSAWFRVRVLGQFVTHEEGRIISLDDIIESERRLADTTSDGPLCIGLDPAGEGGQGDESFFVARRGQKMIGMWGFRGCSDEAHLAHSIRIIRDLQRDRFDRALLIVDREGSIGSRLFGFLRASPELAALAEVRGVRSSDAAVREPLNYGRVRDELWASLAAWIRGGGAIIEDGRLAKELNSAQWTWDLRGRQKATPKEEIRKLIGRSPDRADALALAVWEVVRYDDRDDFREEVSMGRQTFHTSAYDAVDNWR